MKINFPKKRVLHGYYSPLRVLNTEYYVKYGGVRCIGVGRSAARVSAEIGIGTTTHPRVNYHCIGIN